MGGVCAGPLRQSDSGKAKPVFFGRDSGYNFAMETSRNASDFAALPAGIREAFLTERAARIEAEARADHLEAHARRLEHLVMEFKRALYGKKSERLDPDQLALAFEDLETALAEAETAKGGSDAESLSRDKPNRRAKIHIRQQTQTTLNRPRHLNRPKQHNILNSPKRTHTAAKSPAEK